MLLFMGIVSVQLPINILCLSIKHEIDDCRIGIVFQPKQGEMELTEDVDITIDEMDNEFWEESNDDWSA